MNAYLLVCLAVILPIGDIRCAIGNELFEGDACKMEDGSEGKCVRMPECPMRIREVQMGIRRATEVGRCNFDGFVEIVCCSKEKKLQPPIPSFSITQQPPATLTSSSSATRPTDTVDIRPATETTTIINRAPESAVTMNYTTTSPTTIISANTEKDDTIISETMNPVIEVITETSYNYVEKTTKIANLMTEPSSPLVEIITSTASNKIPEMMEISSTEAANMGGNRIDDRPAETVAVHQTDEPIYETSGPVLENIPSPVSETLSPLLEILTSTIENRITETAVTKSTTESANINVDTIGPIQPDETVMQLNDVPQETNIPLIEKSTTVESPIDDTMSPLIEILTSTVANRVPETEVTSSSTENPNISDNGVGVRPAQAACNEYKKGFLGRDGKTSFSMPIMFGSPILKSGEFPFMAALGYKMDKDNSKLIKYKCGGTLISTQHVLTAAHCVENSDNNVPVEVRVGNVNLQNIKNSVQIIPIGDIAVHPRYKIGLSYNNIAIIKLSTPVLISQQVMPICLQYIFIPNLSISINIARVITGWGMAREDSNELPENYNLRLIEEPKCNEFYKNNTNLARGIDDSIICLQDENMMKRTEPCQKNNTNGGVPLVQVNRDSINVIGVQSLSQDCGSDVPGVYASTFKYIDWIEKIVWPDEDLTTTTMVYPMDVRSGFKE